MEIKCRINGIDYDAKLVQGHTFSDDYGEELDSAAIILDRVPYIPDLRPFDDVWLYTKETQFPNVEYTRRYVDFDIANGQNSQVVLKINQEAHDYLMSSYFNGGLVLDYKYPTFGPTYIKFAVEIIGDYIYCRPLDNQYNIFKFEKTGNDEYTAKTCWYGSIQDGEHGSLEVWTPNQDTIVNFNSVNFKKAEVFNANESYYTFADGVYSLVDNPVAADIANYYVFKKVFYKHFLVDQFGEDIRNLEEGIYCYSLQLFSETKGLEIIACPNVSVTEPLQFNKKISIYQYIAQYLYLYSPMVKIKHPNATLNPDKWLYTRKYRLSKEVKDRFDSVYCQDFTLTNPTFRELLTELFKTLDLIPIVRDGVIYTYDKTKRVGYFHNCNLGTTELKKYVNRITGSLTSSNYTDNLRRNHQNALAQYKSASTVEYVGFRNRNNALLTLEQLKVETAMPIYKIDSFLMCYYKIAKFMDSNQNMKYIPVLIKQDITKLIKLESERNLLSQDWYNFNASAMSSIDEMAKYKMCTLGYNIGSKEINGFGVTYTYPEGTWDVNATYIENIFKTMDNLYPFGSIDPSLYLDLYSGYYFDGFLTGIGTGGVAVPFSQTAEYGVDLDEGNVWPNPPENEDTDSDTKGRYNLTACLKSLFFEIDYQPFYSGSVIASKDGGRDCITHIDNTTGALALLEKDGIAQKEKINALGNKTYLFTARYTDWSQIQELGTIFENEYEKDIIIYHREYSFFDNVINCTYYGAKDYVLKQFFTSVYAKHRPNRLMSYEESVNRAENRKLSIVLSKNKLYYEKPENFDINFSFSNIIKPIIDVFSDSEGTINIQTKQLESSKKINYGVFVYNNKFYVFDINAFVCGKSICFNMSMVDNASAGVYIENLIPGTNIFDSDYKDVMKKYYTESSTFEQVWSKVFGIINERGAYKGSIQKWALVVDEETGNGESYSFIFAHLDNNNYIPQTLQAENSADNARIAATRVLQKTLDFPIIDSDVVYNLSSKITVPVVFKDNKDLLNLTTQFELTSYGEQDLFYSSEMCKLSDLIGIYFRKNTNLVYDRNYENAIQITYNSIKGPITGNPFSTGNMYNYLPSITIKIEKDVYNQIKQTCAEGVGEYDLRDYSLRLNFGTITDNQVDYRFSNTANAAYANGSATNHQFICGFEFSPKEFTFRSDTELILNGAATFTIGDSSKVTKITFSYESYSNIGFALQKEAEVDGFIVFKTLSYYQGDGIMIQPMTGGNIYTKYYLQRRTSGAAETQYNGFIWGVNDPPIESSISLLAWYWVLPDTCLSAGIQPVYNKNGSDSNSKLALTISETFPSETIAKTMQLVYSTEYMNQDIEYKEVPYKEVEGQVVNTFNAPLHPITNHLVADVFSVDNKGIDVNLRPLQNESYFANMKSIQYWYYDSQSGSYKFVFGTNLTEEDLSNKALKIYASLVRSKDTRIFDANGQIVGNIFNYAESDAHSFGTNQYYTPNE